MFKKLLAITIILILIPVFGFSDMAMWPTPKRNTADIFTVKTSILPDESGGADLGSTTFPWGDIFLADDKAVHFGDDQDFHLEYDSSNGYLQLGDGSNDFLNLTDDGTTATWDFKSGLLTGLANATELSDAVNLDTLLENTGFKELFYIGNQTLDVTLTDFEDVLTETPDSDPKTLTTIFFLASEVETPTPFTIQVGTIVDIHIDAKVTSVAGKYDTQLKVRLGYVNSDGNVANFVPIGAESDLTPVLTAVQTSYKLHAHVATEITIPDTKRLYLKVIADSDLSSGASYPIINFYFDDPDYHLSFAVAAAILDNYVQIKGDTMTGDLVVEKTITGEVDIITTGSGDTLTIAQARGSYVFVTAAVTVTLPDVSGFDGSIGGNLCVYSTGANTIHVDVFATDRIVRDGTAQADGDKVTSPGTAGAFICFVNDTAVGWRTMGRYGAWTDGG